MASASYSVSSAAQSGPRRGAIVRSSRQLDGGHRHALLLLISVGGYFYHRQRLWGVAAEHLRMLMSGPSILEAGVAAEYLVSTTAIDGQPLAAQVEVVLSGPDGKRLKAYREPTDERGRLRVVIPADLSLPPVTKLKVAAWHRESREEAEMPLRVEPTRYATQLTSDKPAYQPGETIYYRSLTLSRFGLLADRELPVHYEILDSRGAVVSRSPLDGVTQHGVGSGSFLFPHDSAEGQYTLALRSPDQIFPPQKEPVVLRRHPATPSKKGAIERGQSRGDVLSRRGQPGRRIGEPRLLCGPKFAERADSAYPVRLLPASTATPAAMRRSPPSRRPSAAWAFSVLRRGPTKPTA